MSEAYEILGLSENADELSTKTKYRELTKKYHPDINKEPGSEDRFKKINEAYTRIKKGGNDEPSFSNGFEGGFSNFNINLNDFFNPFSNSEKIVNGDVITIKLKLSFKESIFGCKKDIKYKRNLKCKKCNGEGKELIKNSCSKCHGIGKIKLVQGNMIFMTTCTNCKGNKNSKKCFECSGNGFISSNSSIDLTIPGGVRDNNILRVSGMGNFIRNPIQEGYTDIHVHLSIDQDNYFEFNGENEHISSNLDISLIDALTGCSKIVNTLDGEKEIEIPKLSKHKDIISISKMGVNRHGDQKVKLNIIYPDNISELIDFLK